MTNSTLITSLFQRRNRILGSSVPIIVFLLSMFCFTQNTWAQCAPACKNIQVSLDQNCSATITLGMVLDSSGCTGGNFSLQLEYPNGNPVPTSPNIDRSELGTIVAVVTDINSGNSCWSNILVEDKLGPMIECVNDTIDCFLVPEYPEPIVTDNCFNPNEIDVDIIDVDPMDRICDDEFLRQTVVTWKATDGSGMMATCDQNFLVRRIDTSALEFPTDYTEFIGNPLSCDVDYDLNDDGVLDWEILGVPKYDIPNSPLVKMLNPGLYPDCNVGVFFDDTDFGTIGCTHKIMRMWTVREWWCGQEIEVNMPQLIEIIDTTAPVLICPTDQTVTTDFGDCDAYVNLPMATVNDDCNDVALVDVTVEGVMYSPTNGGVVELPVGVHQVRYRAFDECNNVDSCFITVYVQDATAPIAVCDEHTAVSLTNNGVARVYAHTFDDGSHDECGIDRFEVRRMTASCGYDTQFRDYVEFSCCDLANNPIMVVFRVYDLAGNWNECMVEVQVQDKLPPVIVCPPNITVSCTYPYSMDSLGVYFGRVVSLDSFNQLNDPVLDPRGDIIIDDPDNPNVSNPYYWGKDGYALGNCDVTITENANAFIDQCGTGFIARTFTATTASGKSVSCTQTISFDDFTPFSGSSIIFPPDVDITGGCGGDIDPDNTGRPTWFNDDCELIGVSEPEDWVFNFNDPNNPACFKVLRTWKVIDWCRYDALTGEGLYQDVQVIKVTNEIGPTITGCDDVSICSFDPDCLDAQIDVSINATDDCTDFAGLRFSYAIDIDNDQDFDVFNTNNFYANIGNAKNEASGEYPIGTHRIVWTVEDGCGNETTCSHLIEVVNCKKPTPYCYNGLSAALMPMDLDGDGTNDWAELELWASDFDAGSYHPCYDSVIVSFSSDINDRSMVFNCDSIGRRFVELWATAPNGQQDFCVAFIDIQDNNGVCPPGSGNDSLSGDISGIVMTEDGAHIADAMVMLIGGDASDMTNSSGQYGFYNMPFGGAYEVDPDRNDSYLNGVTANDLSIIQRHVSGTAELNSPYKHFAADVTNDNAVDIRDVLDLRKLLLGIYSTLPNHDPWMFLDATCTFLPGEDPLMVGCDETYNIPNFTSNMTVDFIGIKVGDVDEDAKVNFNEGETRTNRTLELVTEDFYMQAGETYEIPVRVANNAQLHALQLTWAINPGSAIIQSVAGQAMHDAAFNATMSSRGVVSQVWARADDYTFDDDAVVKISILATQDGRLSDVLETTSMITEAMAFDDEGKMNVELSFEENEVTSAQAEAFELFQNRPNPFSNETVIGFVLPESSNVALTITDVSGRVIYRIDQTFEAGMNEISIEKSELANTGVMYYRLETGRYTATKKMILLD